MGWKYFKKNICVGIGKASLRRFTTKLKNEVELWIDLNNPNSSTITISISTSWTGRVVLCGEWKEIEPLEISQLPKLF